MTGESSSLATVPVVLSARLTVLLVATMQVHATTTRLLTSTTVLVTTLAWVARTALLPTTTQKRLWIAVTVCTAIPGTFILNVDMADSFGDGWGGVEYYLFDVTSGALVDSGSIETAFIGDGL